MLSLAQATIQSLQAEVMECHLGDETDDDVPTMRTRTERVLLPRGRVEDLHPEMRGMRVHNQGSGEGINRLNQEVRHAPGVKTPETPLNTRGVLSCHVKPSKTY